MKRLVAMMRRCAARDHLRLGLALWLLLLTAPGCTVVRMAASASCRGAAARSCAWACRF